MPIIKIVLCHFYQISKNLWQNSQNFYHHCTVMKIGKLLLGLIIVAVVIIMGSPYYKLYTLKNAYDKGDYAPIIKSIHFERLRPNLKQQLYTKTDDWLASNEVMQGLSLFGGLLGMDDKKLVSIAHDFIDTSVDKGVTPDNLTRLAQGELSPESMPMLIGLAMLGGHVDIEHLMRDYLSTGDINVAIDNQKVAIAKKVGKEVEQPTKPKLSYCGINCFEVTTTIKNQPYTIIMSRHQIVDWQIDNVILP